MKVMSDYITTIGLEVHAELHTQSKMWCGCKNDPSAETPNLNVCEVCMAHPGTLPVPNKDAIKKVIKVGLSVGANIADFTEFDRKNYFYPDIPKGYQISQYKLPIVSGGAINGIELTRIHLEEDTAKSNHHYKMFAQTGYYSTGEKNETKSEELIKQNEEFTLVDYNRAGVPLMELVTEPVIHSAEQASAFARELQRILRYVGASEANMDKGQMRVEANISVSKDPNVFGTKCEVKNLNSFRSVEEAIKYEVIRHIGLIERGEKVIQETRGWDENKMETFSQRKKENAHDYRYFPDPDLPKLYLKELFDTEELKKEIPEMPASRRARLLSAGLKDDTVEILISDPHVAVYFDEVTKDKDPVYTTLAANYLVADIFGLLKKDGTEILASAFPSAISFKTLLDMIGSNELSSRGAKDLLPLMLSDKNLDVKKTAEEKSMIQKNDPEALKAIVMEVIAENPSQVADYKSGKEAMFMYFVGQAMKKSKGAGNPGLFQELLKEALK